MSPLAPLTGLTHLDVDYCLYPRPSSSGLENITPLRGLRDLAELNLRCHAIEDVDALAGLTELTLLDLRYNRVTDLAPLAGLASLETLHIEENPVRSLAVVFGWPRLQTITAQMTLVDDLRSLYLNVVAHDTPASVNLSTSCVLTDRVPNAGYAAAIRAAGVTLSASARASACGYGLNPPPALATFEVDTEGWKTAGDAVNLRRVATGGPSGGPYLAADDVILEGAGAP